jgi:hypothetical protein
MPSNSSFGLVQIAVLVEGVRHQAVAHGGVGQSCARAARLRHGRGRSHAGFRDSVPEDGVNIPASLAIGCQEVAGIEVDRVDRRGVDELLHRHHRRAFYLDAVEVVVSEQKILVFPELVAFDQIAPLEFLSSFSVRRVTILILLPASGLSC